MRRRIVEAQDKERTKRIIQVLLDLSKEPPQNAHYSSNTIYTKSTSVPLGVKIEPTDITRLLKPLVDQELVDSIPIGDAYGRVVMYVYAVNPLRTQDLEKLL